MSWLRSSWAGAALLLLLACAAPSPVAVPVQDAPPRAALYVGYRDADVLQQVVALLETEILADEPELAAAALAIPEHRSAAQLQRLAEQLAGVRFAELSAPRQRVPHIAADGQPFSRQASHQMLTPELSAQWYLEAIGVPPLWASGRGQGVVVAVTDGAVDASHPDLRTVEGYDAFSASLIPANTVLNPDDPDDHGSHVAGIVAANGRIQGVAPEAAIMPVRIFADNYVGDLGAARALRWAVDNGADVIVASWGGTNYSQLLAEAINYALRQGVVVVAAAGNDGIILPFYPAAYPGVIAVGSANPQRQPSLFSNRAAYVGIFAPGERILSTLRQGEYAFWNGTSMAAPMVAGVAALLLEQNPQLRPYQLRYMLYDVAADSRRQRHLDAAVVRAASPGELGGCVQLRLRGSAGEELRRVDVRLQREGREYWQHSDGSGYAAFWELEPGEYSLQVAAPTGDASRDIAPSDRIVLQRSVWLETDCSTPLELTLRSQLRLTLRWDEAEVALAVKEGNWPWVTAQDGARFGRFLTEAANSDGYIYQGGLPEADIRWGVYNYSDSPQEVQLEIVRNGRVTQLQETIPPRRPPEEPYGLGTMRVLSLLGE